jgi:hypothetical protein
MRERTKVPPPPPASGSARRAIERRSTVPLLFLRQLPSAVVPVLTVVLLVAGIAVRGPVGAVLLLLLAVFLAWIGYLSWPAVNASGRLLRVVPVAALVAFAAYQIGR